MANPIMRASADWPTHNRSENQMLVVYVKRNINVKGNPLEGVFIKTMSRCIQAMPIVSAEKIKYFRIRKLSQTTA